MFPIRCYTCNSVIAHKHGQYDQMIQNHTHPKTALSSLEIRKMCCRRMFLGHTNLINEQMKYANLDKVIDKEGTVFHRNIKFERIVSCD
jgi:DNA-directed RNA polymerase subunit N (RpoN/RPB10)